MFRVVQVFSQVLRLFFFKEFGAGSNLPADWEFPTDSVRFHTTPVWTKLFAQIDIHFSPETDSIDPARKRGWPPLQPRSRFAVPPGTATTSIIHATWAARG